MNTGLLHLHSALRWVVLILLVAAIFKALVGKRQSAPFAKLKKFALPALIATHLQLVIGLALYFINDWYTMWGKSEYMKERAFRFFIMEHLFLMLLAIVLITVGYSTAKRAQDRGKQHSRILVFYLIGLILILAGIPWPFIEDFAGRSWF